jgi:actin-like ATPase involved in cell morphogenesis
MQSEKLKLIIMKDKIFTLDEKVEIAAEQIEQSLELVISGEAKRIRKILRQFAEEIKSDLLREELEKFAIYYNHNSNIDTITFEFIDEYLKVIQ